MPPPSALPAHASLRLSGGTTSSITDLFRYRRHYRTFKPNLISVQDPAGFSFRRGLYPFTAKAAVSLTAASAVQRQAASFHCQLPGIQHRPLTPHSISFRTPRTSLPQQLPEGVTANPLVTNKRKLSGRPLFSRTQFRCRRYYSRCIQTSARPTLHFLLVHPY